jgi:hypothetical protein
MFRLSQEETEALLSQNVIPSRSRMGGFFPMAFTDDPADRLPAREETVVLQDQTAIILESPRRGFRSVYPRKAGGNRGN